MPSPYIPYYGHKTTVRPEISHIHQVIPFPEILCKVNKKGLMKKPAQAHGFF
jgi:hypothetical protein